MGETKQAWGVRANPHHTSRIDQFLKRNLIALGWPGLGSVASKDFEGIKLALRRKYKVTDNAELGRSAGALDMLANRMSAGDLVLVPSPEDGAIYVGEVRGDYRYSAADEGGNYPHQRRVTWLLAKSRIPRAGLPLPVIKSLKAHQPIFLIDDVGAVERMVRDDSSHSKSEAWFGDADTDGAVIAFEGEVLKVVSSRPTRDRRLREDKIRHALKTNGGRLVCEVPKCGFDFQEVYGPLGKGFAHVHHRESFAARKGRRSVSRDDLAIVCANCHAMLHLGGKCRSLDELIPD